jgi:predicted NBD/HSP70 family sugar kinase
VKLLDLGGGGDSPSYAMGDLTLDGLPHEAEGDMLGVQLSPGRVRAAVVEAGAVVRRHDIDLSPGVRPDEVMEAVVTAAQLLSTSPTAIGLAIPGEVDNSGRCWGLSGVLGFDGVYIAEEVAAKLGCPASIESDGNAAALAERAYGRGQGHPNSLTVLLGQRLAAGLLLGGEVRRGSSGFGISFAHLRVDTSAQAPLCSCGRRGCLGAVAGPGAPSDAASLQRLGTTLGAGLSLVQNVLDLDAIVVVCAGVAFQAIEPALRETLREQVFGPPASEVPVFEGLLGADAVLIGAATAAAGIGAPPASR